MKTIQEAALELHKNTMFKSANSIVIFEAAVKFAEEFIDVNDELPNEEEDVIVKYKHHLTGKEIIEISELLNGEFLVRGIATHWRPIYRK